MSTRKLYRAIQTSTAQILKAVRNLTRSLVHWLLRTLLMVGRQPRLSRAGFVLPTTILLVMVVLLTVGAIVFRTYTRTTETITDRQQRVIYNAATPAIDRARSKLSFLFDAESDPRYPGGVPSENVLMGMMLNGATIDGAVISPHPRGGDPYTFEDETRIDIGTSYAGDAGADNAWRYRTDTDGDGTEDATVVYTISMRLDEAALADTTQGNLANRAQNMLVRSTPLSISNQGNPLCAGAGAVVPQQGWLPPAGNSAVLLKNFQVDAYVLPDRASLPISTLEMQLDRQLDRGNKWGAWFRYDLEIFPGPQFNWNGAMHTEGNLMLGNGSFRGFMISDPDSCLYTEDASEVSIAQYGERTDAEGIIPAFQGQFLNGFTGRTNWDGRTHRFDLWDGAGRNPIQNQAFNQGNDSVDQGGLNPVDYAIDPVILFTRGESAHRNPAAFGTRRADWEDTDFAQRRLITPDQAVEVPYVDDTYRADNRYGPKPQYTSDLPVPGSIGERIPNTVVQLVGNAPAAGGDVGELGLDGYWERRARFEGMRLIVGQRLELGDPAGWGGPVLRTGDERDSLREALRPFANPSGAVTNACRDYNNAANNDNNARCEEARQRRSLWDNLAAVQSMVVYHSSQAGTTNLDLPVACMASTVHPGTGGTLDNSATFQDLAFGLPNNAFSNTISAGRADYRDGTANEVPILSDFLQGKGTNGWEYEFRNRYIADYDDDASPLYIALNNLAHFAGDPRGGAPSFEPIQDNLVHPFPALSMYGDFSILRRVLQNLDNGTYTYATMPPADKATLNSATCMLGMLAYNLDYLAKFQPDQLPPALMGNAYPSIAAETAARASNPTQYYTGLRGLIRALINSGDGTPARGPVLTPLGLVPTVHDYSLNNNTDTGTGENPQYIGAGLNDANGRVNQPQTYVRLLERWRDEMPANYTIPGTAVTYTREEMNAFIALAQLIINKEQVARDRVWGFYGSGVAANRTQTLSDGPFAGLYGPPATQVRGCRGMQNAPGGTPGDSIRYLCSWRPRYPALYSIFPSPDLGGEVGRNEHGDINTLEADEGRNFTRDRIDSSDPQTRNYIGRADVNGGAFRYQSLTEAQVEEIVSYPRAMNAAAWRLPVVTTAVSANNTPTVNGDTLVKVCEDDVCLLDSAGELNRAGQEFWRLPFKDSGMFNGREMLAVRVLDVNVNFIRQQSRNLTSDFWLPLSGIIYAFREDAVSELNIVRPAAAAWTACNTEVDLRTTNACQMLTNRSAVGSQDPPLNANNRISPKPVDYFPDPDRRPHGFRIQNGPRVDRPGDEGRGLSFITDNAAYVKGNFNLHNDAANPEEEFNEALQVNFGNFYGRNNLNPEFARPVTDTWRPSEILADGVSILSNNFCDGSIEDSVLTAGNGGATLNNATRQRYGCTQNISSYLNQNRPSTNPNNSLATQAPTWRWFRTDVADGGFGYGKDGPGTGAGDFNFEEGTSPIYVSPNGNPWTAEASLANEPIYAGNYYRFNQNKPRNNGTNGQRMNMILISGLVPSKEGQSYGGLHNFPRFLESWNGRNLFISGSIIQLNFSTQATGPFDQDVWSPSAPNYGGEQIKYYRPPNRRWGYDVALQYAPAGPVAQRFVSLQPRRNEFYSEPPANDPYMMNLQAGLCASNPNPRPPQCP
ncbi:MAG: hormogonium polysaccharide biosynthesis protein HpsA [Cyanobacteria bacterium J06638_20]